MDGLVELVEARARELGLTKKRVAQLAGVSGAVLRPVNLRNREQTGSTKRGLEQALRWEVGSIDWWMRTGELPRARVGLGGAGRADGIREQIHVIDVRVSELRLRRQELMEELMAIVAEGYA